MRSFSIACSNVECGLRRAQSLSSFLSALLLFVFSRSLPVRLSCFFNIVFLPIKKNRSKFWILECKLMYSLFLSKDMTMGSKCIWICRTSAVHVSTLNCVERRSFLSCSQVSCAVYACLIGCDCVLNCSQSACMFACVYDDEILSKGKQSKVYEWINFVTICGMQMLDKPESNSSSRSE